jgi:GT2 family glycosyltransferase
VVVITRNRRPELVRTLQRMTALPERPPVIVVDNASADGSAQAAAAFPGVTVIAAARNLGAAGRNLAVQRTSTPYVAFCDDDTWWEPGALDRAADLLDACPRLASVTGRILVEPGGTEDPITPELRHSPVPGPPWLPGPALLSILAGASMLRAAAFAEAGGFSPRLWLGGEEELLSLDLAAAGWWMCWAEDVIVHHSASAVRDPRQRRILGIRNTLWTAWLRRPPGGALRRTAAVLRSVPKDRASAAAVARAAAGLPWVLRDRRVIPPRVEAGLRLLEAPQRHSAARRYVGLAGRRPRGPRRPRSAAAADRAAPRGRPRAWTRCPSTEPGGAANPAAAPRAPARPARTT